MKMQPQPQLFRSRFAPVGKLSLAKCKRAFPILAMIMFLNVTAPAAAQPTISSTFDSGTDGWVVVTLCYRAGGVGSNDPLQLLPCCVGACPTSQSCIASVPCTQLFCEPSNGGGFLEETDTDGSCGVGHVQYWSAPAQYLGNHAGKFHGSLSFDVQTTAGGSFDQDNIILKGAGLSLVWANAIPTPSSWAHITVNLLESEWRLNTPEGAPATASDLQSVLGSLDALYIRAEYGLGVETGRLDNVVLQAPCETPQVTANPQATTVIPGATAQFAISTSGSGLIYQWRKNNVSLVNGASGCSSTIEGATTANLLISNVSTTDNAIYDCVVTNNCGTDTSDPAVLTVTSPPAAGDVNHDGQINGLDVQAIVNALLAP